MSPNRRITLVGLRRGDHRPFPLVIRSERPTLPSIYSRPGIPRACTLEVTVRTVRRTRPSLAEHVVSAAVVAALTLWLLKVVL